MSSVKVLPPVMASSKWWYQCWMPAVGWPAAVAGWGDVAWMGSARRVPPLVVTLSDALGRAGQ